MSYHYEVVTDKHRKEFQYMHEALEYSKTEKYSKVFLISDNPLHQMPLEIEKEAYL